MKTPKVNVAALLLGLLVLAIAPVAVADDADVEKLVRELKGEEKAVERTPEQLQAAYVQVLDALLPKMGSEDVNEQKTPQQNFQQICWYAGRPGAEAERAAVCKAMAAKLGPDTPKPARIWLLKQLEYIGRAEAVDALANLLSNQDPLIRERARQALEGNTSPEAVASLLAALEKADTPEWRVGLINAVAYRGGEIGATGSSVDAFIKEARSDNDAVRSAAIAALARLGAKAAADVIAEGMAKGPESAKRVASDSYLLLADKLCEKNDKEAALGIYRKMLGPGGYVKCAAIVGLARAGGINELPTILEALGDGNAKIKGAGMAALQLMPGEDVTRSLCEKAKTASPELRIALLVALAQRGDKGALQTFLDAAKDQNEDVRIAAYEGMGKLAAEGACATLVGALLKAPAESHWLKEREAAAAALALIPGESAVDAVIKGLGEADPNGRVELVKTLATRRSDKVVPTLLKTAADADEKVRAEAFKALGDLADEKALPQLVDLMVKAPDDSDRKGEEKAIAATCRRIKADDRGVGPEPLAPVLAAMGGASVPVRCSLLRVLGKVGGPKALDVVARSLKDENDEIKDAAVRALADWPDADPAAVLLDVARDSANETHRVLALRGYVRVLGLPTNIPMGQILKLYQSGFETARRPEDKKLVLSGLGGVKDLGALDLVRPYLSDEALRAEAALAMMKIAEAVSLEHRAEAEAALREVAEACKDEGTQKQVKAAFERIAQYDDYVTAWLLSRAYTEKRKKEKELFDIAFPPEEDVNTKDAKWKAISGGADRSAAWKADLEKLLGGSQRAAYLRSWVRSDRDQKARMEMGSDDGLKVWLNGKVVSEKNVNRGIAPGQDKVEVDLKEGWNDLLLKVTQGGSQWAACVRVRATDGGPLPGVLPMGDPKALGAVAADLGNDNLKDKAGEILTHMAAVYAATYPEETKAALTAALQTAKDEPVRKQVEKMIEEAGKYEDYITTWRLSGPYTEEGKSGSQLFDAAFPPENPDHKGAEWKPMPTGQDPSKPWCMLIEKVIEGSNRTAYLLTYVWSPKKQEARLEMGSDDGIKAWLNGKLVHANNASRPITAGSDKAQVTLDQGWNSLLLKITQGGGNWSGCARFRDPSGFHLDGLRTQAETPDGVKFVPVQQQEAPKAAPEPPPKPAPKAEKPKEPPMPTEEDIQKITEALPAKATAQPAKPRKLLVFSVTRGFHHNSIPWAARMLEIMGKKTGAFEAVVSDDLANFEPDQIQSFDAICFNNTTRECFLPADFDKLPKDQQDALRGRDARLKKSLQDFVQGGKGLIGIHAATDSFYQWPEFGKMMGAWFNGHPWHEPVGVKVDDLEHPVNAAFKGQDFTITDEIYQFKEPYSRDELRVLLSLDTSKTKMDKGDKIKRTDGDFAVSWVKTYGKGRVFYCSLGHRNEIFWNPAVLQHYLDGVQFALGDLPADATPSGKAGK